MAVLALGAAVRADEMTLDNGFGYTGSFGGYDHGHFLFVTTAGRTVKAPPTNVKTITLSQPAKVNLVLASNQKQEGVRLNGYAKFALELLKGGTNDTLSLSQVKRIEMPFASVRVGGEDLQVETISHGEEVDLSAFIKKGVVTVLHFHMASVVSSVRQGNYLAQLAAQSQGRVVVLRVTVPNYDAPICKALGIDSLPQFWFYSSAGTLAKKLTQRFTESDIDGALAETQRKWGG